MISNVNKFKESLLRGNRQIGLWLGMGSSYSAEICAVAGFDWLLIDGEHAPNNTLSILAQLQAISQYDVSSIARIPASTPELSEVLIKQYLDLGVQSLMVPMIEDRESAQHIVRCSRYPVHNCMDGRRGVASSRASRWGQIPDYFKNANSKICLIIQIETVLGLNNLTEIASVNGIDGIFIGPADLSASIGHIGNPEHPTVQSAIHEALDKIHSLGKFAGILSTNEVTSKKYIDMGFDFVAVGVDTNLLIQSAIKLIKTFK